MVTSMASQIASGSPRRAETFAKGSSGARVVAKKVTSQVVLRRFQIAMLFEAAESGGSVVVTSANSKIAWKRSPVCRVV